MNSFMKASDVYGEQVGSIRPLHRVMSVLFILAALSVPTVAGAAYSKDQTDVFVDKITKSYGQMIDIAALLHDYDPKMITAVIVVESEGNEVAISHKGAKGLMQLMPQTAKAMGAKDPKDPFQNILAGTKYLKQLENQYGFDNSQQALVAYNMGPSRAKRWLSQYDSSEYGYVKKVMFVYNHLLDRELEKKRFAQSVENKIDEVIDETANTSRHIMTKPRSISMASLPLTLPSTRRDEIVSEN